MPVERVLVAAEDAQTRSTLAGLLVARGCQVTQAASGAEALLTLQREAVDLVLADTAEGGPLALGLLESARDLGRDVLVVPLLAPAAGDQAAAALRQGAFACLAKPPTPADVGRVLERAAQWHALLRASRALPGQDDGRSGDELVGRHPRLTKVLATVRRAAASKATLLVQGESGTGKELVARLAHTASPRARGPFIKVNCAALAETLLESELFGHEKGAFTGAIALRRGRFELAHGGTLLLDEISEIPPALQAKLLRAIEEEELERVGGAQTLKVDVRLVCTTNRDLPREVEEGRFRADLFHRLNVVPVLLPPLRERRDDIPLLAAHFLRRFRREAHSPVRTISKDAMAILLRYPWPGNVRELRNLIHRAVVLGESDQLRPEDLPPDLTAERPRGLPAGIAPGRSIEDVERDLILKTLRSTGGNKTAAARLLKVTPRTLRNKLGRYAAASEPPRPVGTA
ncbi:MAG: sigma-54-dependent Fis family transcriptional regulator [Planctomycetes bacterium]|nr:sigma-54-dependent Fis family transcriptional regulator [Planctomycetota bacterium]